jgi:hypothetical protein
MDYKFKVASWDKGVWTTTIISILVPALIIFPWRGNIAKADLIALAVIVMVDLIIYLYAPQGYVISSKKIIIKRHCSDISIDKMTIKDIKIVEEFRDIALRNFASGGFLGYFGIYSLTNGERTNVYCTRWDHVVFIVTDKANYIISPVDAGEFCKVVNHMANTIQPIK